MFIELTDHLRCPDPHEEQFLVLLPDRMEGRRVWTGSLGCPVCGQVFPIEVGIADFGGGAPASGDTALTAEAIVALLGIHGPGGYLAMIGAATTLAALVAELLPDVRLVLINPPEGTADSDQGSVIRSGRFPLKQGSMRGVIVGQDAAGDPVWIEGAAGATLGGLRVVAEGPPPDRPDLEVLASAGGVWVGKRR